MDENLNFTGNSEIEKALKEFETKSKVESVQKIPEVSKNSKIPKMVQLIIKYSGGVIKEQKQAEYILLGFSVLAIIVSFFLFLGNSSLFEKKIPFKPAVGAGTNLQP